MIYHYVKSAYRNLLKYKTQNLISTLGLAVGLLCFSICFYCSRYMQNVDQCFDNYDRLVDIRLMQNGQSLAGTPSVLVDKLRKQPSNAVEAYSCMGYSRERPFNIYLNETKHLPYTFECMEVDSCYKQLFTPTIIAGSWEVASHIPNAIVLTESIARKVFTSSNEAIGKQMVMTCRLSTSPDTTPKTGGISYTIQAVIKDMPTNISMCFMKKIDALVLNDSEGVFWNTSANNDFTGTYSYALLQKGKNADILNQEFQKVGLTHRMFDNEYEIMTSLIGKDADCSDVVTVFSWITGLVGTLIFLVALLNFFHFQVGSIINRRHEFSIRKALGNNTFQLSVMLFIQLLFVIVIAFILTTTLIELLSSKLQLSMFDLNLDIDTNTLMLQSTEYLLWILALSTVICFCVALYIRKVSVQTGISHGSKRGRNAFRNFMQGVQFFICWLFVSMTVALYLQSEKTTSALFDTLSKLEKSNILSIPFDYSFMKNEEKLYLIDKIRQHSAVKDVLLADISFLNGVSGTGMQLEKDNRDKWVEVNVMRINMNFRSFMNIPLLAGKDIENQNEMYIDDIFDKHYKDMLGKNLYNYEEEYAVRGVMPSFRQSVYSGSRNNEPTPYVFLPSNFIDYIGHCYIKCHSDKVKEVAVWIAKTMQEVLPENIEPKITTFLEDINEAQAVETKLKDIILFFSLVSLIITMLGVYASITLDTERRQKEVAIRKINGAGIKHIICLFVRLYIILLIVTALVAFPVVYMILQQWKEMYEIFFNAGVLYWGGIFLGVTLLTLSTVIFKILKIARINPAEVIKNE